MGSLSWGGTKGKVMSVSKVDSLHSLWQCSGHFIATCPSRYERFVQRGCLTKGCEVIRTERVHSVGSMNVLSEFHGNLLIKCVYLLRISEHYYSPTEIPAGHLFLQSDLAKGILKCFTLDKVDKIVLVI